MLCGDECLFVCRSLAQTAPAIVLRSCYLTVYGHAHCACLFFCLVSIDFVDPRTMRVPGLYRLFPSRGNNNISSSGPHKLLCSSGHHRQHRSSRSYNHHHITLTYTAFEADPCHSFLRLLRPSEMLKHGSLAVAIVQRQVMIVQGMACSQSHRHCAHLALDLKLRAHTASANVGLTSTPILPSGSVCFSLPRSPRLASPLGTFSPFSLPTTLHVSPRSACSSCHRTRSRSTWSSAPVPRSDTSNSSARGQPSPAAGGWCSERQDTVIALFTSAAPSLLSLFHGKVLSLYQ